MEVHFGSYSGPRPLSRICPAQSKTPFVKVTDAVEIIHKHKTLKMLLMFTNLHIYINQKIENYLYGPPVQDVPGHLHEPIT